MLSSSDSIILMSVATLIQAGKCLEIDTDYENSLSTTSKTTTANLTTLVNVKSLTTKLKKLRGLSPRANYTDRAAAAGRRS